MRFNPQIPIDIGYPACYNDAKENNQGCKVVLRARAFLFVDGNAGQPSRLRQGSQIFLLQSEGRKAGIGNAKENRTRAKEENPCC
jgi:hypothetical protein